MEIRHELFGFRSGCACHGGNKFEAAQRFLQVVRGFPCSATATWLCQKMKPGRDIRMSASVRNCPHLPEVGACVCGVCEIPDRLRILGGAHELNVGNCLRGTSTSETLQTLGPGTVADTSIVSRYIADYGGRGHVARSQGPADKCGHGPAAFVLQQVAIIASSTHSDHFHLVDHVTSHQNSG